MAALSALLLGLVLAASAAFAAEPTATIDPASAVTYTTAHVSGHVNPQGSDTSYHFDYSADPVNEGWSSSPTQGPLSAEAAVFADLENLKPGREYTVYLVSENADGFGLSTQVHFTTEALAPPTVSIDAPSSITGTTAHFSGQINPQAPAGNPAAADVDWHFTCNPECPGLSTETIAADNTSHPVSADASGLKLNTTYEVSLVAENAAGPVTAGPEVFATPALAPQLDDFIVVPLSSEAELKATINPGGTQTTYHFEYGPSATYGQSTEVKTLPAGETPVAVKASLFGLTPASGYHFRLVASNSVETVEGPDQTFTTSPSGSEADSCPNAAIRTKQGARRLADCRAYERVSPAANAGVPVRPGGIGGFRATADGNKALFATYKGSYPGAESTPLEPRALSIRTSDGWLAEPIDKPTSSAAPGATSGIAVMRTIWAVSKDMTRMVVISPFSLGGEGVDDNGNLYIYDASTGRYALVMTTPDHRFFRDVAGTVGGFTWIGGSPDLRTIAFEFGEPRQVYVWSESSGLRNLGNGNGLGAGGYYGLVRTGSVSDDGSRIYYQDETGAVALDESGVKTTVSISRRIGDSSDPVFAYPEAASPDGRYLIFSACLPLTEDAPAHPFGCEGNRRYSLYRYDAETDDIEYLTHLGALVAPEGILRAWPERKEAYFRAGTGLYHLHDGEVTLIAPDIAGPRAPFSASPDGRYFGIAMNGGIYLYDAQTEVLSCASCRRDGGAAIGGPTVGEAEQPYFESDVYSQAVTDDGTVFFDTLDPLVPTDVNGTRDVYSYRDGRNSLISPGTQPFDARFAEVTPSGRDVFFTTAQRLVSTDTDAAVDLYDARVEGGLAAQNVTPIPPCSGDACRGATPAAPEGLNAATETLHGRENPRAGAAKRCGKGQQRQRRKGKSRCVKQHKRNAKQGKQSHNRSQGR